MEKTKLIKMCGCGKEAELKLFTTFSYWYCHSCKDEVKESSVAKVKIDVDNGQHVPYTFEQWQRDLEELIQTNNGD